MSLASPPASPAADTASADPFAAVLAAHGVRTRPRATAVAAAAAAAPASAAPAAAAPAQAETQAIEVAAAALGDFAAPVATAPKKRGRKAGSKKMGRRPLAAEDQRTHLYSFRANESEKAAIESRRGKVPAGEWLRLTVLEAPPPAAPAEINRTAWQELARAQGNLNQIAHRLNSIGDAASAAEVLAVMEEVRQFRATLLGAKPTKPARPRAPAPAV